MTEASVPADAAAPAPSAEADAAAPAEAGATEPTGNTDTAAGPGPAPDLATELAAFREQVATLAAAVEREHERAAFRESVVDRLHGENQQLRRGELEQLLAPVRSGLIRLHDQARRAAAQCRAASRMTPEQAAALLSAVADEAGDVLAGVGVERFDPVSGEAYDPARHRPVAAVPVTESGQHHTVVEVRAAGFGTADKVVRRAEVVLARYEPPTEPAQSPSAKEQP